MKNDATKILPSEDAANVPPAAADQGGRSGEKAKRARPLNMRLWVAMNGDLSASDDARIIPSLPLGEGEIVCGCGM